MISLLAATLMALAPVNEGAYAIKDNIEGQHAKVTYMCDQETVEGLYPAGSNITLTVNPNIFYELSEKPVANVDLTQDTNNDKVYYFIMPEYEVNIDYKITLNNYIDDLKSNQYIGFIITWVIDTGFLSALVILFAKYRKYKAMTTKELNDLIQDEAVKSISDAIVSMDKEEIAKLTSAFSKLESEMDVLQKCFILAQDDSPEGKAALMEYLSKKIEKTEENKEVHEAIEEKKEEAKVEIAKEEKIVEKVKNDYQPVE